MKNKKAPREVQTLNYYPHKTTSEASIKQAMWRNCGLSFYPCMDCEQHSGCAIRELKI